MGSGAALDEIYREIVPTRDEERQVQERVDRVVERLRAGWSTAELRPAGSWAKGTMLRGRKEADMVVVLAAPPDANTLEAMAKHMADLSGLRRAPDTSFKAVQLVFTDGVSIDLLPVAKSGVTPDGPSIPRKLRHAMKGIDHVEWFKREGHGRPTQAVVRLLKHFRDGYRDDFGNLPSFALEVLAVNALRGNSADLEGSLMTVLAALSDANKLASRLPDPADPNNDVLSGVDSTTRERIAKRSQRARDAIAAGTWSAVFSAGGSRLPPPATNLGGKTLA